MRLLLEQGSLPNDLNIRVSQRLSVVLTAILILAVFIQSVFDPWAMLVLPGLTGLVLAGDFAAIRGGLDWGVWLSLRDWLACWHGQQRSGQ